MLKLSSPVALTCLLLASPVQAALFAEDFEGLTPGDLNNQNGWVADAKVDVVAGGIDYSNGAVTIDGGNQHVTSTGVSADAATPLASHAYAAQSGDVWMSFTIDVTSSANGDRYWFFLGENTSIVSGFTGAVGDTNTGSKSLFSEIRVNTTPTASNAAPQNENEVYFLVARLSKDGTASGSPADAYDKMELWINPDSDTLGAATRSVQVSSSTATDGIDEFGLTVLGSSPTITWDNLLIGTSQADVLDVYIPEPASLAFVGLGGLLMLWRSRYS